MHGDLSVSFSKLLDRDFTIKGGIYYEIGNLDLKRMQMLAQARIMGEKSFIELYKSKSFIAKKIDEIIGYGEKDIETAINNKISEVKKICTAVYIYFRL